MVNVKRVFIVTLLYLLVCVLSTLLIKPFSIVNFIGPAASVAGVFAMVWSGQVIISVLIGTVLFSSFLAVSYGTSLNFSVFLIAMLTIFLQSFWVKHLTYKVVRKQEWLKSRKVLFTFLMKVGPLAGVISASAAVVLSILDEQTIFHSIEYVFFTSWVGSVLTAVFLGPIFLFSYGEQELSKAKRVFVLFVSGLGLLAIILLFKIFYSAQQEQRIENFKAIKAAVKETVLHEINHVNGQVLSLAALFKSNKKISLEEFTKFSRYIYQTESIIQSFEWAPYIGNTHKVAFEQQASDDIEMPYLIKEELISGQIIPAKEKPHYLPLYYIYPQNFDAMKIGIDLFSQSDKEDAIDLALSSNSVIASQPLKLVQLDNIISGVFVFYPVINNFHINSFSPVANAKNLNGFIIAQIKFDGLFEEMMTADISKSVSLYIQDITHYEPFILYGEPLLGNGRLTDVLTVDVFGRQWQIQITEIKPWVNQSKAWNVWAMLIGVTLGGVTFQLLILMIAAYSIELSHQVVIKTRELILEKEISEQKNQLKNNFLETLSGELKAPISAIKYYIAKFDQQPTFAQAERSMADINNASHNLTQLIDNINELNEIERGAGNILNLSIFDFHHFIEKLKTLIDANSETQLNITFTLNDNVPYLLEADELRIQKMLMALVKNAEILFKSNRLNVSIKAHIHQSQRMTLFFVITPFIDRIESTEKMFKKNEELIKSDLSSYSTSMAMVKELAQLFDGDVKLNQSPTGMLFLNASVKVSMPSTELVFTQSGSHI